MYEICAHEVREGNGGRAFPRILRRMAERRWRAFPRSSRRKVGAAAMARVSANLAADGRSGDGARFREARGGWAERRRVRMSAAMAGARESRDGRLERRRWRAFPRISRRMDGAAAMARVSAKLATEDRTAARVRMSAAMAGACESRSERQRDGNDARFRESRSRRLERRRWRAFLRSSRRMAERRRVRMSAAMAGARESRDGGWSGGNGARFRESRGGGQNGGARPHASRRTCRNAQARFPASSRLSFLANVSRANRNPC